LPSRLVSAKFERRRKLSEGWLILSEKNFSRRGAKKKDRHLMNKSFTPWREKINCPCGSVANFYFWDDLDLAVKKVLTNHIISRYEKLSGLNRFHLTR